MAPDEVASRVLDWWAGITEWASETINAVAVVSMVWVAVLVVAALYLSKRP